MTRIFLQLIAGILFSLIGIAFCVFLDVVSGYSIFGGHINGIIGGLIWGAPIGSSLGISLVDKLIYKKPKFNIFGLILGFILGFIASFVSGVTLLNTIGQEGLPFMPIIISISTLIGYNVILWVSKKY